MGFILTFLAYSMSLMLVLVSIPPIIRVARAKNLFEPFDERKVHTQVVPPLGGVAIFIGFTLSLIIASGDYSFPTLKYIIAAVVLLFFIGLKDDLIILSARKKFVIQVIAAVLLVTLGGIRLTCLHGFLGIYSLPPIAGILLSLFLILAVMNAWNLIDGIDGLASGLALFASLLFGTWFLLAGHIPYAVMAFALTGSLTGFFFYNVFGNKNKLFMGDTGSLIVGLVVAVLAIQFNEFNITNTTNTTYTTNTTPYAVSAAPAFSFALLAVPLLDTLRVIVIRVMNGRSPFSPDKNHTHHRLLELLSGHLAVTTTMVGGNILLTGIALLIGLIRMPLHFQLLLVFCTGVMLCLVPSVILRIRAHRNRGEVPATKPVDF